MSLLERMTRDTRGRIEASRPRTAELWRRATATSPARPFQPLIVHGAGAYVVDVDDHRLLDCVNSMSALVLGHAHPKVRDALLAQAGRGTAYGHPHPAQFELIDELVDRLPSADQLVLANSGTEAVLIAMRIARACTGRRIVMVVDGGFHGHIEELAFDPALPSCGDVVRVPLNDIGALERRFAELAGQVSAFLIEPVLSRAGQLPASVPYLSRARTLTAAEQAVLVYDEVATFRQGRGGAQERVGVTPDLTVLGKLIGGGLPVGAVGGRADSMAVLSPGAAPQVETGGTFTGNPMTAVAGVATLEELTPSAYERLDQLGNRFRGALADPAVGDGLRVSVTGVGSLLSLHFERLGPASTWQRVEAKLELPILHLLALRLWELGFLTSHRGMYAFSTATTDADIDLLVEAVLESLCWLASAASEHVKP